MTKKFRTPAVLAGAAVLVLTAACTGGESDNKEAPKVASHLPTGTPGEGTRGGTLKVPGMGDPSHLDPVSAYNTSTWMLLRAYSRQLVSYPTSTDLDKAATPVEDMASYEVSSDALTYTFKIKDGVKWSTDDARQITSVDLVRGLKRLCNPVVPAGPIQYWTGTIVGMQEFCDGFGKVEPSVKPIKDYVEGTDISGITTPDDSTVEIKLIRPASDFLNIMALPMSSPAPIEFLDTLPDSPEFRQNVISSGPYVISTYKPDAEVKLIRNKNWDPATDSLRKAYVDGIEIKLGQSDSSVQQQLQNGDADLAWDTNVPTAQINAMVRDKDPNFMASFSGTIQYVPFNMKSEIFQGTKGIQVRKALQYCTNKKQLMQVTGGPAIAKSTGQILPSVLIGFKKIDPYATPGSAGDPAKCKSMLAEAGYPDGLTVRGAFGPGGEEFAQAMQSSFAKAGVTLKLVPSADGNAFGALISNRANSGKWDLAIPMGWAPDWQGNGARALMISKIDGSSARGEFAGNFGRYDVPEVNDMIDAAIAATSVDAAAEKWAETDAYIMNENPAWIPIQQVAAPQYFGTRVKNAVYQAFFSNLDPTNIWLDTK